MMLALLLLSAGTDPCAHVVDRTATCAPPPASTIAADATKPPPPPAFDAAKLPAELAFLGVGLAIGGGAAIGVSFAFEARTDDEKNVRAIEQIGGASLLVWSGLVGASAVALQAFDPSSGEFRLKSLFTGAD